MRLRGFGYTQSPSTSAVVPATARLVTVSDQRQALIQLRDVAQLGVIDPLVRERALLMVDVCQSRDDICDINAVFDAVKYGRPDVPGFERGFKYVADPNWADLFTSPRKIIEMLDRGINGGDCDDHAGLICALLGSIGFKTGLLAYGPPGSEGYTHVLAVVKLPKRPPSGPDKRAMAGLDTTVRESSVGWLPPGIAGRDGPRANVLVTWLE